MVAAMGQDQSMPGRDHLVEIVEQLQAELEAGAEWDNDTLVRFLGGFGALLGSIENAYVNTGRELPSDPWVLVGEALLGARHYE